MYCSAPKSVIHAWGVLESEGMPMRDYKINSWCTVITAFNTHTSFGLFFPCGWVSCMPACACGWLGDSLASDVYGLSGQRQWCIWADSSSESFLGRIGIWLSNVPILAALMSTESKTYIRPELWLEVSFLLNSFSPGDRRWLPRHNCRRGCWYRDLTLVLEPICSMRESTST